MQVGKRYGTDVLAPTNQILRPAGPRIELTGGPTDMAVAPGGNAVAASVGKTITLYSLSGAPLRSFRVPGQVSLMGLAFSADGGLLAASYAGGVSVFAVDGAGQTDINVGDGQPCGLVFDPGGQVLYVALNAKNQVAKIDLELRQIVQSVKVGVAPLGLVLSAAVNRLFVSNWGGRAATPGDSTLLSNGTPVVVDTRGLPASGTVSAIDIGTFRVAGHVEVGLHPGGLDVSRDGARVAVANANSDSVTVIDAASLSVLATAAAPAFPNEFAGSSPTAVAFSIDGKDLYVACGGNNSVAVLSQRDGVYQLAGSLATDWYPIAIAAVARADGEKIVVAHSKGNGTPRDGSPHSVYYRSGSIVTLSRANVSGSTEVASLNDPFGAATPRLGPQRRRSRVAPTSLAPVDLAALNIRHVFLIVKENRTYDQILGDLAPGNGDPSLAIFGARVTPNHHRLASGFVTLDNFYASGVVSPEGHHWITQGMTSDYIERSNNAGWPRTYPFAGDDPLAIAPTGFLWENARRNGLSVRVYGEYTQAAGAYSRSWTEYYLDALAPQMKLAAGSSTTLPSLRDLIEPAYPAFAINIPDQFRARIFLDRFRAFVDGGNLPNLVIVMLPGDHTAGTLPGYPAPAAMVADNDLALGRIVEAISQSPYWPQSAIFALEDDAQDGVDHVDGHRTVCLIASPFVRRGALDSTSYNQTSVVRTVEVLLGLPPMNKFDAAALPMETAFTTIPDYTPFVASASETALAVLTPPVGELKGWQRKDALASLKMDFATPDAAPEEALNRIVWRAVRGPGKPYPKVRHRPECPPEDDDAPKRPKAAGRNPK